MTWHESLLWVLGLVAAYALATNLHWLVVSNATPGRHAPLVLRLLLVPAVALAMRASFYLGVPAAALALRVVSPAALGLVAPASLTGTVRALAMAVATLVCVLLSRWWFQRANGRSLPVAPVAPGALGWTAVEAALLEAHWALFRAAMLSAGTSNPTLGVALAVTLLGFEAWTNPWHRAAMADPAQVDARTSTAALGLLSAATFLASGSSVLAWALHVVVGAVIRSVAPRPAIAGEPGERAVVAEPTIV